MKELVSIIITTFKRPELLNRSLRSALNQTYPDIEVLVVDDNNPNSDARIKTEVLLKEKFSDYRNIKYIKMPMNVGACAARNKGVLDSKGTYIQFLDDDDEMSPEKITKQIAIFQSDHEKKIAAVGCYGEVVDEEGKHISDIKEDVRGDVFFFNMCNIVGVTSQILLRKDVYVQSGGFEKMHASQDHWMLIKLFSVSPFYDFVPESLVKIYHHIGERISTNVNKPLGAVELYEKCKGLFYRLTPEQIVKVMRVRNENIISVFLHQGRKKESLKYWRIGLKERGKFEFRDLKVLSNIIMGEKLYDEISMRLKKIRK